MREPHSTPLELLAFRMRTPYPEAMPNITVRNVPAEVHDSLLAKAETQGLSLQRYLVMVLTEHASRRSNAEILAEHQRVMREHYAEIGTTRPTSDDIRKVIDESTKERDRRGERQR